MIDDVIVDDRECNVSVSRRSSNCHASSSCCCCRHFFLFSIVHILFYEIKANKRLREIYKPKNRIERSNIFQKQKQKYIQRKQKKNSAIAKPHGIRSRAPCGCTPNDDIVTSLFFHVRLELQIKLKKMQLRSSPRHEGEWNWKRDRKKKTNRMQNWRARERTWSARVFVFDTATAATIHFIRLFFGFCLVNLNPNCKMLVVQAVAHNSQLLCCSSSSNSMH